MPLAVFLVSVNKQRCELTCSGVSVVRVTESGVGSSGRVQGRQNIAKQVVPRTQVTEPTPDSPTGPDHQVTPEQVPSWPQAARTADVIHSCSTSGSTQYLPACSTTDRQVEETASLASPSDRPNSDPLRTRIRRTTGHTL